MVLQNFEPTEQICEHIWSAWNFTMPNVQNFRTIHTTSNNPKSAKFTNKNVYIKKNNTYHMILWCIPCKVVHMNQTILGTEFFLLVRNLSNPDISTAEKSASSLRTLMTFLQIINMLTTHRITQNILSQSLKSTKFTRKETIVTPKNNSTLMETHAKYLFSSQGPVLIIDILYFLIKRKDLKKTNYYTENY